MSFVGLDVGGTYIKGARLNSDGSTGPVARRPVPPFLDPHSSAREIDPNQLLEAVREVLEFLSGGSDVRHILITGQMAGVAFVDDSGSAVAPVVSWQDLRGQDLDQIKEKLGPSALDDLGDGIRVGSPLATLLSIGVPTGARVTSLLGFVAGSLAEDRAVVVHATDAASWGLYDVRRDRWSEPALGLLGIDSESLPQVSWEVCSVGHAHGIEVRVAVGDQQASLLGAGLSDFKYLDFVSVNLATGGQVSILSDNLESPTQLRPYFLQNGHRRYLHTVTHLPAGRALTRAVELERGSNRPEDWEWVSARLGSVPAVDAAVDDIVGGVVDSVFSLGAQGRPILFSGGLVQKFGPLRDRISSRLSVDSEVFHGDDAALAGLARCIHVAE